ncbi:hypothetical protein Tco_0285573 [Tanacetum coccineum]
MVRGGKLRGHIPGVGPVMPGYVRSRLSYTAPVDRSRDVDFMMNLMRSDNRFADAFAGVGIQVSQLGVAGVARDEIERMCDDTGGEDGGDDTSKDFFLLEKNWKCAMTKTIEAKSVEKSNSKGPFPSDMSLGKGLIFPSDMSLGKILPPWHQFLDQKIRGATFRWAIVMGRFGFTNVVTSEHSSGPRITHGDRMFAYEYLNT